MQAITDQQALGLALRALRKAVDLTLSEVADAAGASTGYISNVENGNLHASADWVRNAVTAIGRLTVQSEDAA